MAQIVEAVVLHPSPFAHGLKPAIQCPARKRNNPVLWRGVYQTGDIVRQWEITLGAVCFRALFPFVHKGTANVQNFSVYILAAQAKNLRHAQAEPDSQ